MAKRAIARKRKVESHTERTVREISSGGILYRVRGARAEVALIRVRDRWCLPKGQVEAGEGVAETAVREVREETGLRGEVVAKLGDISYWYTVRNKAGEPTRIFKRVYFYLLRHQGGDVSLHDAEVDEAAWFSVGEAMEKLAYPSERKIMEKAAAMLEKEVASLSNISKTSKVET